MMEWQGLPIPSLEGFTGFAPPEGNGSYRVAIQVEALGEMEARDGCNLHRKAPAGSVFTRLTERAGLDRDSFVIWNTVWARPPRNFLDGAPWEAHAVTAYQPLRERAFELYRPRVFVAMGNVALRSLTQYGSGKTTISHVQGYVCDGPYDGTWVVPTFHPSAIMQGLQGLSGVFMWALQRAVDIAKHGHARVTLPLIAYPSLDDMEAFARAFQPDTMRLDFDIETPESGEVEEEDLAEQEDEEVEKRDISYQIIRASLAHSGRAISFPWQPPYREIALRLVGRAKRLGVWNEDFDTPRLVADGARIEGRVYDWMKLWKRLQPSLPTKLKCRSLEFVAPFYGWPNEPWKHLNAGQPEYYSACDALALAMCGDGIERDLRAKGGWELAERHVIDVYRVLQKMSRNGLPYDKARAAAFEADLKAKLRERDCVLQTLVPPEVRRPKQKTGYKKVPKDTTGLALRRFKVLGGDLTESEQLDYVCGQYDIVEVTRWCVLEPFNPGSPGESGQMADLIRFYGHKIGTNRKTKKGSVDDDLIKKLIKKLRLSKKERDRELLAILEPARECRQLKKVLGTYVEGWRPGSDGRIHSTPGFWGRMDRISWRRPNISATIQDKKEDYVAQGFRKCVAASPGKVLIECVAPESKILRSDLTWVNAVDVRPGDELIGFTQDVGHASKYVGSRVESVEVLYRPCVKVQTTAGTTTVAENHLFFARASSGAKKWVAANKLMGHVKSGLRMPYFGAPWEPEYSWEAGYLAGFADGEGSVHETKSQIAQNAGPTLDYVLGLLRGRGFSPKLYESKRASAAFGYRNGRPYRVQKWEFERMYETMRFLGVLRPTRLMQKARQVWEGRRTWSRCTPSVKVQKVESIGMGPVIAIKTSTGTLISDGYFSHNCDWKGIEAVLVGWFAGDVDYIRLARLGVHSFMASHLLGRPADLSWRDEDLAACFKEIKRNERTVYDNAKHTVHGANYGMGPRLMADLYEMPEREARRLLDMYFGLFPKVRMWQKSVLDRASRESKLTNPFGFSMPFWEVYRWDSRKQTWALGEDAKSAIAFLPRDTAAAMLKEVLLRLEPLADEGILLASTHDSLTCECDERDVTRIAPLLKYEMERPVPQLRGLSIGVDVKAGPAWHDDTLEPLDIPCEVIHAESYSTP